MNAFIARLVTLSIAALGLFASAPASHAGISWCGSGGLPRSRFNLFDTCANECFASKCNNVRMDCYQSCRDRQPVAPSVCPEGMSVSAWMPTMCYPTCPEGALSDGGAQCLVCRDGSEIDQHGMCPSATSVPVLVSTRITAWSAPVQYYVWSSPVAAYRWSVADQGVPVACEPDRHLVGGLCYPN